MSGKSALSNSIKSNCEQQPQWIKTQTSTETKMETNVKFAGDEAKDRLYEPKHKKKAVRVLTVIAYVFSVSLAAIMLSLYYMFIWNPKVKPLGDGGQAAKLRCDGIQSQRLQQSPQFDELPMSLPTMEAPDTTVLASTTESSGEELYELASAETKRGIFLSHLFPKYASETNSISNETLYK